jgi:broad specificity phosphatase PhoE
MLPRDLPKIHTAKEPKTDMTMRGLLTLMLLGTGAVPLSAQDGPVVVYVVRHAERLDDGAPAGAEMEDPPLSEAGTARALELVELFRTAGLTHIHSTDYERTRATARPVSEALALELAIYDATDIPSFAERLRASPGTHLVVGHSNTSTALVDALGGESGGPIATLEYDRAYVIVVVPGGATGSAVFRYGSPYLGSS